MTLAGWNDLYERCPAASPFLHPAWQTAWTDCFGSCPLRVLEVRRRGELVGMARCSEYDGRLVFTGNGISDRLGILAIDYDAAEELMRELGRYCLDLQEIAEGSPLLARFPYSQCSVCPVLNLAHPVPAKLARTLRQQKRYLGPHRFETTQSRTMLERLFELHRMRWESRGEQGVLADPALQEFHRRAANPLVRMHALYVGGDVVGVLYGFARNGTMHFYLSGFDARFDRYSPGSLLIEYAVEYARSAGDRYFDFLRGPEPYKYRWGAVDRPQYRILT